MPENITTDPAKTLEFVQAVSVFGKKAMDEVTAHREKVKQAAALRPAILQSLLDTGTIEPGQKEAADAALADHAQTMQLLKNAVTKIAEHTKTAGDNRLGHAEGSEKAAQEFDSLTSPFVGQRTSVKKASDRALFAGLGIED